MNPKEAYLKEKAWLEASAKVDVSALSPAARHERLEAIEQSKARLLRAETRMTLSEKEELGLRKKPEWAR